MRKNIGIFIILLCVVAFAGCAKLPEYDVPEEDVHYTIPEPTKPVPKVHTGYISSLSTEVNYYDADGMHVGSFARGTQVEYIMTSDGKTAIQVDGHNVYLHSSGQVVAEAGEVIPKHTLYVRSAVNLRDQDGRILDTLLEKGTAVEVTGYDYLESGRAHMYKVGEAGYVMPWYLTDTEAAALENYNGDGNYPYHEERTDLYGGGGAANLDYFPREKGAIAGNEMPSECRALYIASWCVPYIDQYIEIADESGINAFVVDISDGTSIGYAAGVMSAYCPSAVASAQNSVEDYQAAIKKLKDKGYYVIGRIIAFNDGLLIADHPEFAITNTAGNPMNLAGCYWATLYNRDVWQFKVDLAVEAVELMGFNEIQYDYVRFPELTRKYEKDGTINYHNTYNETKAQAIQRFLMYATDIIHESGAYVSADVFGESAYTYVTAYGQYWPAISNVVDVISGMPYPDHFTPTGKYYPWEHPYDTLFNWGYCVRERQRETATPAVVRTWIQAYDSVREPYVTYGPTELLSQIRALRATDNTGGYMTWNAGSSIDKYRSLMSAFTPPEEEG